MGGPTRLATSNYPPDLTLINLMLRPVQLLQQAIEANPTCWLQSGSSPAQPPARLKTTPTVAPARIAAPLPGGRLGFPTDCPFLVKIHSLFFTVKCSSESVPEWESHIDSQGELFYVQFSSNLQQPHSPTGVDGATRQAKPEERQEVLKKKKKSRILWDSTLLQRLCSWLGLLWVYRDYISYILRQHQVVWAVCWNGEQSTATKESQGWTSCLRVRARFICRPKLTVRLQMTGLIGPHSPWSWKSIQLLVQPTGAR